MAWNFMAFIYFWSILSYKKVQESDIEGNLQKKQHIPRMLVTGQLTGNNNLCKETSKCELIMQYKLALSRSS